MPVDENEPEPGSEDSDSSGEWEETSAAEEWRKLGQVFGYLSAGGLQMVLGAGLGLLLGRWLDGKLGTGVVFTAVLAFAGLMAGVFQLYRLLQALQRAQERQPRQ